MKIKLIAFIAFIPCTIFCQTFFQPPSPPMPMPMNMPYNYYEFSKKYQMTIHLANGDTLSGESAISPESDSCYVTINKRRIYPHETSFMESNGMKGVPYQGHWIFCVNGDRLKVYKLQPDSCAGNFRYLQKDSLIVDFSNEQLRRAVQDNPQAYHYLQLRRNYHRVALWMDISGAALALVGTALAVKHVRDVNAQPEQPAGWNESSISFNGLMIFGIALCGGSIVPWLIPVDNELQSINTYNGK